MVRAGSMRRENLQCAHSVNVVCAVNELNVQRTWSRGCMVVFSTHGFTTPCFSPRIVHHFGLSIIRWTHRYNVSPACKHHPTVGPLKTTTKRPPLGGDSNASPPDQKAPSTRVSLDHSLWRQSRWLGHRPSNHSKQQHRRGILALPNHTSMA